MTPLTTSAFDLPAHLAPKADPALIADHEQQAERYRDQPKDDM